MKARVLSRNELNEFLQIRMAAKRLWRIIAARKLGFGDAGMNFIMANLMQQHLRTMFPAFELRDQMMA